MKSVFPVVEETVLLDTLCSADNNVNQATETLLTMGFNKQHNITNIVPKLPRVTLTNNENDYEEDDMFWLRRKGYDHYDKTKSTCSSWPITSVTLSTPTKKINTDEQIKSKCKIKIFNIIGTCNVFFLQLNKDCILNLKIRKKKSSFSL